MKESVLPVEEAAPGPGSPLGIPGGGPAPGEEAQVDSKDTETGIEALGKTNLTSG